MKTTKQKNPAAVALGSMTSERKAKSSRANGTKGGRPRKSLHLFRLSDEPENQWQLMHLDHQQEGSFPTATAARVHAAWEGWSVRRSPQFDR